MLAACRLAAAVCAVLAGYSLAYAQYTSDGFNPGTNGLVRAIAVQPDGKILIGGDFTLAGGGGTGGAPRTAMARLNADGTLDPGFANSIPDSEAPESVYALVLQPDGKILVGGMFGFFIGPHFYGGVMRLNSDGSIDTTFDVQLFGSLTLGVRAMALQPDGRVLTAGGFNWSDQRSQTGFSCKNVCRFLADGTLDESFNPGGSNNGMWAMALQADGKVVLGGDFTMLGGVSPSGETSRNFIARLNSNGSLDIGFNPGASSTVRVLAMQSDGRILAGGTFFGLGGGTGLAVNRRGIGRIEDSGAIDPAFNPGPPGGFGFGTVFGIQVQPDGRILVGGQFDELWNVTAAIGRRNIGRVNADGSIDLTFDPGATNSFSSFVDAFGVQPDGRILVGGQFTTLGGGGYGNVSRSNVGRLVQVTTATPLTEMVVNGGFDNGTANWNFFATPDNSYLVSAVNQGVLEFWRLPPPPPTSNQALAFQETGIGLDEFSPLVARFDLGNSSSVRKRVSVLILDSNFADLNVCTFWLEPMAPMRTYWMKTHSTHVWANAAIYFYAATAGSDGGAYRLDNVSLQHDPSQSKERTDCVDPTAPAAPGGAAGADLIANGAFNGMASWSTFGQIVFNTNSNMFQFYRPSGEPAGVVLQGTNQPIAAGQIVTATFLLGNVSGFRKRVTVLLNDGDFSDLSACTFWLRPFETDRTYTMRAFATKSWTNAMFSLYAANVGVEPWARLDNVTMQQTPGTATPGTECIEPGGSSLDGSAPVAPDAAATAAPGSTSLAGVPVAIEPGHTLRIGSAIDLRNARAARLAFESLVPAEGAVAVEVSLDGITWRPVADLLPGSDWARTEIDLDAFTGREIFLRFSADPKNVRPWQLRHLRLVVER